MDLPASVAERDNASCSGHTCAHQFCRATDRSHGRIPVENADSLLTDGAPLCTADQMGSRLPANFRACHPNVLLVHDRFLRAC
jgi:hypothetical protein